MAPKTSKRPATSSLLRPALVIRRPAASLKCPASSVKRHSRNVGEADLADGNDIGFRVLTFNMLAPCWVGNAGESYPGVKPELLEPSVREAKVFKLIASSRADLVCLQECEGPQVPRLRERFGSEFDVSGFASNHPTSAGVANGVVFMTRRLRISTQTYATKIWNAEGSAACILEGHFLPWSLPFVAVNSHIAWGPDGHDQICKTLDYLRSVANIVWCGDFNAKPEHAAMRLVADRGFSDAFAFSSDLFTYHSAEERKEWELCSKRVDYVLFRGRLQLSSAVVAGSTDSLGDAQSVALMAQRDRCERCLRTFGSDHVPLLASFSKLPS